MFPYFSGLSKEKTAETELKSFVGTPQYIAPEIIVSRVRPDKAYDVKVLTYLLFYKIEGRISNRYLAAFPLYSVLLIAFFAVGYVEPWSHSVHSFEWYAAFPS